MMTPIGDTGSREELTTELATLARQLRDLSNQWENVGRTITEKVRLRRELIARQTESNEDHAGEIARLQSDVYALRDRLEPLRASPPQFRAPPRTLQQGRTTPEDTVSTRPLPHHRTRAPASP